MHRSQRLGAHQRRVAVGLVDVVVPVRVRVGVGDGVEVEFVDCVIVVTIVDGHLVSPPVGVRRYCGARYGRGHDHSRCCVQVEAGHPGTVTSRPCKAQLMEFAGDASRGALVSMRRRCRRVRHGQLRLRDRRRVRHRRRLAGLRQAPSSRRDPRRRRPSVDRRPAPRSSSRARASLCSAPMLASFDVRSASAVASRRRL